MSDRFNSTIQADTRSGVHRFFDREILGRVYDVVDNKVLNPFRPDSEIPRAISPLTEFVYGVRADAPITWDNTAAIALGTFIPGSGKTLKATRTAMGPLARTAKSVAGRFGTPGKIARAENKLAGMAKEVDLVKKSFAVARETYKKSGAAAVQNLKEKYAVERSFKALEQRRLDKLSEMMKAQKARVAALTGKSNKAAQAVVGGPAAAKRITTLEDAGEKLKNKYMAPSDYAKVVAEEARKQVREEAAGGPWLKRVAKDYPKAAFGLKWGAITGVPAAAYTTYAVTSKSREDATTNEATDAKKNALNAEVANGWNSVTNSTSLAAAYDNLAVTRKLMRQAKLVASEQVRLLGNDENAKKVQQAKAMDTMIKVADVLRGSDAWNKALEEFDSKIDDSAELLTEKKLLRLPPGTDRNQLYEDSRRELMNRSDEDKVLGEPYYPLDPQNGGPQ